MRWWSLYGSITGERKRATCSKCRDVQNFFVVEEIAPEMPWRTQKNRDGETINFPLPNLHDC